MRGVLGPSGLSWMFMCFPMVPWPLRGADAVSRGELALRVVPPETGQDRVWDVNERDCREAFLRWDISRRAPEVVSNKETRRKAGRRFVEHKK